MDFTYRNGEEAQQNAILESLGGGVGLFDYDLDGRLDLFLPGGGDFGPAVSVSGRASALFRQVGGGRFENASQPAGISVARQYSHGVAIADYDNDGFPDALVTGYGGVTLWHNGGDGTFDEITNLCGLTDRSWSSSAGWGDLDGDGVLDLYLAHYVDWSPTNHPPCTSSSRDVADVCPPRKFEGLDDSVFLGNGDGTFRDGTHEVGLKPDGKGLGVVLADLDHDGDLDVYVANDTVDNFLYVNDGRGHFAETGLSSGTAVDDKGNPNGSMGVGVLDFDGDGLLDLWVANYEDETFALYRNEDHALFRHCSSQVGLGALGTLLVGFGTVCGDFDGDGDEDIAVANGHVIHHPKNAPVKQEPLVLLNDHKKRLVRATFPEGTYLATPHTGRGLATGDLDNDGDLDLLFVNTNEPAAVLLNSGSPSGRWLKLQLVGTASNREAIGARCVIRTSDGTQLRHRYGGGSYLSSSDRVVHFGIANGAILESIEIHWPSGVVTKWNGGNSADPAAWSKGTLTIVEQLRDAEPVRLFHVPRPD
ncbi:MAG: CRTAC1 family protein [Candidatus Saccharimonas sp.]|nr:CRTAC1 family protein [Planctomycetaceae bacterium]